MVRIEKIDTSNNAKIFANMINDSPKTYFLDGKWGSGKTEYLKEVEKYLRKDIHVINVELWKPKDKSSLSKLMFENIHPHQSEFIKILIKTFIFLSVLGSIVISFKGFFQNNFYVSKNESIILGVILSVTTIITTLYTFIDAKWVDLNRFYMEKSIKSLVDIKRPKLLIIDDFDRLETSVRDQLFLLFNSIHGRTRVIFIGDLHNLDNVKQDYMSKIIDKKVSLPNQMHSSNVAVELGKRINEIIGNDNFQFDILSELFEKEKRTARDANHLLSYIQIEFQCDNKRGKVQNQQQILIIYLYLFHIDLYHKLVDQLLPDIDEKYLNFYVSSESKESNDNQETNNDMKFDAEFYTNYLLQPNDNNPTDYISNRNAYYINEIVNIHSIIELRDILNNDDSELEEIFMDSNNSLLYSEFLNYINRMSIEEYNSVKRILEKNSILTMKSEVRHSPNELIRLIFEKKLEEIDNFFFTNAQYQSIKTEKIFRQFDEWFDGYKHEEIISVFERIYYYRVNFKLDGEIYYDSDTQFRVIPHINRGLIKSTYSKIANDRTESLDFGTKDYDAEALLVLMNTQLNKDSISEFKEKKVLIEKLKNSEYLAFWDAFGIRPETDSKIGQYLVYGDVLDFAYGNKKYKEVVLEKIISITN